MYNEARSVFYKKNTFVFGSFASFAIFLGLTKPWPPLRVQFPAFYSSCTTERLRAMQAMTKVEIENRVGGSCFTDFLSFSRLIRAGLSRLTNLASLKLSLMICDNVSKRQDWKIDDCMFSKPASFRQLSVDVRNSVMTKAEEKLTEKDAFELAKRLVHRILKLEGFSDKTESFWRCNEVAASPKLFEMTEE